MNTRNSKESSVFRKWKESAQFPRPSSALATLRTELPTWKAYIFTCAAATAGSIQKNWGYHTERLLPEILVQVGKCSNPIKCRSRLLLACLIWLEHDPHVVSYYQPNEIIMMDFDGVEYAINADLWVQCKDGEVWMLNLIDSKTEQLCKKSHSYLKA
ncbi:MAG: hypothetical protein IPG58_15755 [Acidobacteria bacterium]|nr:hypothetical protein [Acidobacteriota bacterium]